MHKRTFPLSSVFVPSASCLHALANGNGHYFSTSNTFALYSSSLRTPAFLRVVNASIDRATLDAMERVGECGAAGDGFVNRSIPGASPDDLVVVWFIK